jgi:hypothetical protein
MVLCAAIRTPVSAQEPQEGRRGRATRQPTFADTPARGEEGRAQRFLSGSRGETTADELSGEPTESVAVTLWILTVVDTAQPPADELSSNLAERIGSLPSVIGSLGEVQALVDQTKVAGLLQNVRRYRLVTLNGQAVTAQRGRNQPRIVATAVDLRAGRMNTIQMEPVGTMIELRPRIDSERNIQISVKIGESAIEKSTDVLLAQPPDGSPAFADVVTTRQFNTAATLKNNTAVLLQSVVADDSQENAGSETELIILGASIVPTDE